MKITFKKLIVIISIIFITACTNETEIEGNQTNVSISHFIRKNYNVYTTPNTLLDSSYHVIANNKMQSSTFTNLATLQQSNVIYNYENNKISEVSNYTNNNLTSKSKYIYNNDKLTEFRTDVYSNNQITNISKSIFTHTQDTIFSQFTRSSDGGQTFTLITNSKIVLDQNKNRVYFEIFDNLNNETKSIINTYDSNNNAIKEELFLKTNGTNLQLQTNIVTYNNKLNSFYLINLNTYGKENLMLVYNTFSNNIANINVKGISPNCIETYQSNWSPDITFEIINNYDQNNYSSITEYKTKLSNVLTSKFDYEFLFN